MDLDAIEAAEKEMTPGPWSSDVSRPGISGARCPREAVLSEQGYPPTLVCRAPACDGPKRLAERAANLDGIALLRNSAPDLIARIREQDAEIERLRRFVTDQSRTCYSCESCGHARTTRECLWCENGRLRKLCLETAEEHDELDYLSPQRLAQLRAAAKGEA